MLALPQVCSPGISLKTKDQKMLCMKNQSRQTQHKETAYSNELIYNTILKNDTPP